jgi:4-diphosphocytidyl-2-C-methyl-D-erythritol kinase
MRSISLLSNAKINLFFSVHGLRPDGYCEVSSIILPVNFGDKLTFSKIYSPHTSPAIAINLRPPIRDFDVKNNTILTTVNHFRRATGLENIGLKIDVEKRIPIGGGFGGGSSNAICALNALNALYGNALPPEKYLQIARNIGVDCPFFIRNCPQLAAGRGDILRPLPRSFHKTLSAYSVLLFCPNFAISTRAAYDQLKQNLSAYPAAEITDQPLSQIKNIENIAHNIFQDLVLDDHPPLKSLFQWLQKCGYHPCLTGSGSGCFIVHRDRHFLARAEPIIAESLGPLRLLTITTFRTADT